MSYTDDDERRRRRRDDDDDDRGRRRRDDDDDDDYVRRPRQLTGLDGMFANTNIVILVLFGICCNGIALILGIVGLAVCKDEKARQNAMIVTIIGGILTAVGIAVQVAGLGARLGR
jgi:hypothetical protein